MVDWKDMIEDWIQMRASLQKQVKALGTEGSGQESQSAPGVAIGRLKACIAELNALLKEHASVGRISRPE